MGSNVPGQATLLSDFANGFDLLLSDLVENVSDGPVVSDTFAAFCFENKLPVPVDFLFADGGRGLAATDLLAPLSTALLPGAASFLPCERQSVQ